MKKISLIFFIIFIFNGCMNNDIFDKAAKEAVVITSDPVSDEQTLPANYDWKLDGIWMIGGHNGTALVSAIDVYDPYKNEWHAGVATLPVPVRNASCAVYEDKSTSPSQYKIYIFGGINAANAIINTVQIYNVTTSTWSNADVVPAAIGRQGNGVINVDGNIYLFGGSSSITAANSTMTVFRFKPWINNGVASPNGQWGAGTQIGTSLMGSTVALIDFAYDYLDGEILIAGGRTTAGAPTNAIGSFWISSVGKLTGIGVLKQARYGVSAASYNSGLAKYAFFTGGTITSGQTAQFPAALSPVSRLDVYIPYAENGIRVLVSGPNMLQSRAYSQSVVKNSYLYVFGGAASVTTILKSVERLKATDPLNSTWETLLDMPTQRYGFRALNIR